jgi:aryl-alcohol dehydrogenase-like predicted oxidoreductase
VDGADQRPGPWFGARRQSRADAGAPLRGDLNLVGQLELDVDQARRATEVGVSVVQVGYNRLDRTAEQDVLPSCLDQDLGVIAREPLANGYLSGKTGRAPGSPPTTTGAPVTTRNRPDASWSW